MAKIKIQMIPGEFKVISVLHNSLTIEVEVPDNEALELYKQINTSYQIGAHTIPHKLTFGFDDETEDKFWSR